MIWGGISLRTKSQMVFIDGNLNNTRYIDEILEPVVHPMAEAAGDDFILMDDNARPHRAHAVNDYLRAEGIQRMDPWPACSPDLNPIEHLWDEMGRTVNDQLTRGDTLNDLRRYLQAAWDEIPQEKITRLVRSMRRRCLACIAAILVTE